MHKLLSLLLLTSCLHVSPMDYTDGKHGYTLDCTAKNDGAGVCYRKAMKLCDGNYKIVFDNKEQDLLMIKCQ